MEHNILIVICLCILCGTSLVSYVAATDDLSDNESVTHFFLQEGSSGSFLSDASESTTLILSGVKPDTIVFSDRPHHDIGFAPMEQFVTGFDWNPSNPPNAVLIIEVSDSEEAIIGLEIWNPEYDEETAELSYKARILETTDFESQWLSDNTMNQDQPVPEQFGRAVLLIDDCPCKSVSSSSCDSECRNSCYSLKKLWCEPCGGCCSKNSCECTAPAPLCGG